MANMSYCRFRNTLSDLRDCIEHMHDENLNRDEHNARRAMIGEMFDALQDLGFEVEGTNRTIESLMEKM